MGTVHIPTLLEGILEATAAEAAAKARIASLRAAIEDEARRRYAAEGAAPSWNTPQLGKVRLDPEGEWLAGVADVPAFGSWVADHFPTEATVIIALPATDAADALQALEFVGIKPVETRTEVRSAWEEALVKRLVVDVEELAQDDGTVDRTITVVDPDSGLLVDGMTASRKPAKLVVALDRDRRTAAITGAQAEAAALLEAASGDEAPGPDPAELHTRRVELEGLRSDQLATIAKGHRLGSSGTKAELAERIARAELATGNVIRPAAELSTPTPDPLPDDVEVEEVSTVPTDDPLPVGDNAPGPGPFTDEEGNAYPPNLTVVPTLDQPVEEVPDGGAVAVQLDDLTARRRALLDGLSREVLRSYAKSVSISAAGTKGDLLDRLVEAGTTVTQVNDYARSARA